MLFRSALAQLEAFCDGVAAADAAGGRPGSRGRGIPLFGYEPGRNLPAEAGTSGLSAALKFGTLSPRQAWAAAQQARQVAEATGVSLTDAIHNALADSLRALGQKPRISPEREREIAAFLAEIDARPRNDLTLEEIEAEMYKSEEHTSELQSH